MRLIRATLFAVALGAGLVACGSTTPTQAPSTTLPPSSVPSAAVVETPPPRPLRPSTSPPRSRPRPNRRPRRRPERDAGREPGTDGLGTALRAAAGGVRAVGVPDVEALRLPDVLSADWTVKPGNRKYADAYYGFDGPALFASRAKNNGLTLKRLSSALTRYLPDIAGVKHFKIEHNRPARLGPLKARRIEFNYRYKGKRYWAVGYLAVKGGNYYWVDLETTARTDAEDRDLAARFARTFRPR